MTRLFPALLTALAICTFAVGAAADNDETANPCELVDFSYTESLTKSSSETRLEWKAQMRSTSPSDGLCRIVLRIESEGGEITEFPSALFSMDALGSAEIGDLFLIPTSLWQEALAIDVDAENMAPGKGNGQESAAPEITPGTPDCVEKALAAEELFLSLRVQIRIKNNDLLERETRLMTAGGLLSSGNSQRQDSEEAVRRQEKRMEREEEELARLEARLLQLAEDYCTPTD